MSVFRVVLRFFSFHHMLAKSTVHVIVFILVGASRTTAIRHSQSYLARKAGIAASHAAACNRTIVRPTPVGPVGRTRVQAAHGRATTRTQADASARAYGGGSTCTYPSGITSVFREMRREEEQPSDLTAPELPEGIGVTVKTFDTRYGRMSYRTIGKSGEDVGAPSRQGLNVVCIHGLGTDGSNWSLSLSEHMGAYPYTAIYIERE